MLIAILAYFFVETFSSDTKTDGKKAEQTLSPEEYARQLRRDREEKDELFHHSNDSPITDKGTFKGLSYFEPDLSYRVRAALVPYTAEDKELKITYTDGTVETFERLFYADFFLDNEPQRLLLLKNEGTVSVFFRDATSGSETYGGGRYLDFTTAEVGSDSLVLDFNEAYNPYCAYNPSFACPLPPAENTLRVAIRAGEKYQAEK
ncbi:DUF1684 domain-containing protein [Rhabdobacter roseus]|nr:DUF1684 domain-containing protein [Rhabdobacter roseus]